MRRNINNFRVYAFVMVFITMAIVTVRAQPVFNSVSTNNDTISKYDLFEISADITASFTNPFDYSQVYLKSVFTSPSGNTIVIDGFYYQHYLLNAPNPVSPEGDPIWKVRFSPDETGIWTYILSCTDNSGTAYSDASQLLCISGDNPGFVRKSGQRFLKFDDGTSFLPVGLDIPWNLFDGGFYKYEEWLDSLADNGATYAKIIMAPWSFGIEWNNTGLGDYTNRLDIAFWIDWVLNKAAEEGIYLQICPLIHNEVSTLSNNDWQHSPYNAANGGPCEHTWEFYSNAQAKSYYKRKLRYINSRWGYSSNIMAWELFTETDNTGDWNDHRSSVNSWLLETGQYLRNIDPNDHLISTSYAFFEHDEDIWNNSLIDFTQMHIYHKTPELATRLHSFTQIYSDAYNKQSLIGEFGLGHDPSEIAVWDPDGIAFHNSLWATSLSGSMGSAMAWHWDSYIESQNLFHHFGPVSAFVDSIPTSLYMHEPVSVYTESSENIDFELEPGFNQAFKEAPENDFTIGRDGSVMPPAGDLGKMLYGYTFNSYRNPPHFYVHYDSPGHFSVNTGNIALFSNIKIWVDYQKVLDKNVSKNSTYTVDISPGEHMIFVENTGNWYFEVDSYVFGDYTPLARSYALYSPYDIAGWVQNRRYNWEYVNTLGTPPPLVASQLFFDSLYNSYYDVEWWNTQTGQPDSNALYAADNGVLVLDVPQLSWDAAYKITYVDATITPGFLASARQICCGDTVVFTNTSSGIVNSSFWSFPGGSPALSWEHDAGVVYSQAGIYNVMLIVSNDITTEVLIKNDYIIVDTIPDVPGPISGPVQLCQGDTALLYSVIPDTSVQYYEWLLPQGFYGQSDSSSIIVNIDSLSMGGEIMIRSVNHCGSSAYSVLFVDVFAFPGDAGPVSGPANICRGESNILYSIDDVDNADTYIWTLPDGFSGFSDSASILLDVGTNAVQGSLEVYALNNCGAGRASSLLLNPQSPPGEIPEIHGDTLVCQYSQDVYYYAEPSPGADTYEWSLPYGAHGSSTTNEIWLAFDSANVCGLVKARGLNDCGYSPWQSIGVCVAPLPDIYFESGDVIATFGEQAAFQVFCPQNLYYQWQQSNDMGFSWHELNDTLGYSGSNTSLLTIYDLSPAHHNTQYRCVVFGNCEPSVISDPAVLRVAPQGWDYDITGIKHRLRINASASLSYNEEELVPGTYIGVFYDNDGQQECAGMERWYPDTNIIINAWGDNIITSEKEGFAHGETFSWKLFDDSRGESDSVSVSFLFGPSTFTQGALSVVSSVHAYHFFIHDLRIPLSWSGISSWVIPDDDSISCIFQGYEDDVLIIQSDDGKVWWPSQGINTIHTWDNNTAYKIKTLDSLEICFKGISKASDTVFLSPGWNIIPVNYQSCVSTLNTEIFSSLGDSLVIAKSVAGTSIYWPEEDIITLTELVPGKAYYVLVEDSCFLDFSVATPTRTVRKKQTKDFLPSPWQLPCKTSSSHVLSLRTDALEIFGDREALIAVFTPEGICAGITYIKNADENNALVAFGDDPLTEAIEGFTDGQHFLFKAWMPDENAFINLDAVFLNNPTAVFQQNELDIVTGLFGVTASTEAPEKKELRLFPNPFENTFCIYQADAVVKAAHLKLFDGHGQLIEELEDPSACISFPDLSPGIYLIKVLFQNTYYHAKLIKK